MQNQGHKPEREVSSEALRLAKSAVLNHAGCFWMRQPTAPLIDRSDVELVIRRLRENGDRAAWKVAHEIQVCL
ncbi:MAG TPA: hypothetical protein P5186_22760 [Candidatus Paceibacterota bacterium]|nr:hypothetical protein [Verrucomicrobiota bacterium]HRY50881.1 hypothetical protein [Candidatus Paceibacterota bacterium]